MITDPLKDKSPPHYIFDIILFAESFSVTRSFMDLRDLVLTVNNICIKECLKKSNITALYNISLI
jgi:hypothetical protein